jgi:PAS domain S-box-containing protein
VATSDNEQSSALVVVAVLAGLSWVVAGLFALERYPEYRTGWLMLASGNLWALAGLQLSDVSLSFTVGVALGQLAFGPWIHLTLGFPEGRLRDRVDRALVTTTYVALAVFPTIQTLFDPTPLAACTSCPDGLAVADAPGFVSAVTALGATLGLGLSAVYVVRIVRRYRLASPPLRRVLGPVYVATVGGLLGIIATNTVTLASDRLTSPATLVTIALFGLVPVAFLVGLVRTHLARGSVVGFLGSMREGRSLRDALAAALGDPSLEIVYPLDKQWVDGEGRDADRIVNRPATILTPVEAEDEVVAGLVHDASLAYNPALLDAVVGAAALALRTQGLQAEARAQFTFLRTLVETAPSLFIHVGTDGRIRNQNAAAVEAAGFDDEELVRGQFFWNVFISPEERREVIARFQALAPDYGMGEYENEFTNARGEKRVIFWRSAPVHTETGEVAGIISGGIDITERRHRELELERERDAMTTVLESIQNLVVVLGRDGSIRDRDVDNPRVGANRAFRQTLGWPDDALVHRPFFDLIADEDDAPAREAIAAAAAGQTSEEVESELHCADGGTRGVAWTATPVADVTGRTDGLVLVSGVDVTERRIRELQDRRRRDFMEAITGSIPSYLLVLRPDGTVRELGANRAFEDAFGWTDTEIAGHRFVGTITPASDHAARTLIARAAEGAVPDEIESRWETREGDSRIVAWSVRPVVDAQGEKMVLVSGMDVTARRLQEEEIRASRVRIVSAADEARRRLERDLHDGAQQRLVSLSVMLGLAESRLPLEEGQAAREILSDARAELAVALEELRELARGIHPAILTDRGLGPALEALVVRAPVPVTLELPGTALPPQIESAAYFVVSEALTNVVKYSQASSASVQVALNGETVSVSVRDDGVGGADPRRGSGLSGLADRLASLDGRLVVESAPGEGTCVRAEIPYRGRGRN